jgi:hypothetical protein|nr:MAG TPA_asm: hypothetical protein [Caudoviricetes sp.]
MFHIIHKTILYPDFTLCHSTTPNIIVFSEKAKDTCKNILPKSAIFCSSIEELKTLLCCKTDKELFSFLAVTQFSIYADRDKYAFLHAYIIKYLYSFNTNIAYSTYLLDFLNIHFYSRVIKRYTPTVILSVDAIKSEFAALSKNEYEKIYNSINVESKSSELEKELKKYISTEHKLLLYALGDNTEELVTSLKQELSEIYINNISSNLIYILRDLSVNELLKISSHNGLNEIDMTSVNQTIDDFSFKTQVKDKVEILKYFEDCMQIFNVDEYHDRFYSFIKEFIALVSNKHTIDDLVIFIAKYYDRDAQYASREPIVEAETSRKINLFLFSWIVSIYKSKIKLSIY